jgi:hypothetical protein
MTDSPLSVGLLRGIATAESDAHLYLPAGRHPTPDPEVRAVLTTVAAREGEHGMAFAKRVVELGFDFERRESERLADDLEVARSDRSDREKAEHFRLDRIEQVLSFFDDVFKDHTIDIRTGELLGRYIAEEHDTARLAGGCYANLCQLPASAAATKSKPAARPRSRTTKAKRPAAART